MEEIISYFYEVFIPKIIDVRINFYKDEHHCVGDLALATKNETDKLGRKVLESFISELDMLIKELPERKRQWYVEHSADKKSLTTTLGEIVFTKTLYTSKTEVTDDGKELQCYLLDKFLELEENQSMTEDVVSKIYEEAVDTSYQKAGVECAPEGITKQTVKNLLHKTQFPKSFQIPEMKKTVDYLYIDADEDHYHLQFHEARGDIEVNENGRKNNDAMTKMIYVYEGIEPEAPKSKRDKLINTHYFLRGYNQSSKDMWKEVFEYIDATYDVEKIKKIYINSDGGQWIKTGYRGLADTTFVLDEFHLSKYVFKMIAHTKDTQDDARNEIYSCIRNQTKEDFFKVVEKLKECTTSEKTHKKIDDAAKYIASNWTAAKLRLKKKEGVVGSSTEGHVYHALSRRMSTQALGWSIVGANQMARLREYKLNGGDMLELAKYQKEDVPLAVGAEEVVLSATAILASERTNRSKLQKEYGKYAQAMSSSLSLQSEKRLTFYLHGKL